MGMGTALHAHVDLDAMKVERVAEQVRRVVEHGERHRNPFRLLLDHLPQHLYVAAGRHCPQDRRELLLVEPAHEPELHPVAACLLHRVAFINDRFLALSVDGDRQPVIVRDAA